MIDRTRGVSPPPASGVPLQRSNHAVGQGAGPASSFEEVLRQQRIRQQAQQAQHPLDLPPAQPEGGLTFSKHALQRLQKREIHLLPEQSRRLESAVHSVANRGSRQSMVVLDGMAFIVNVQELTVVTALDAGNGSNTVVTNIDSAVVA
jgi:flagellar operon protein